jgi:hypothetical protein
MTKYNETDEGQAFVQTGESRETSPEIMKAIAFFAKNNAEAETLWNGDGFGLICHPTDLWEHVTKNGLNEPTDYFWGASGSRWWADILGSHEKTKYSLMFVDAKGRNVTGLPVVDGYRFADYFPGVDLTNTTADELRVAYLGPDADGIGVVWSS